MSAPVRGGLFSELPATFSTYELLELLPGGGMSFVYKARTRIGKIVVVKILKQEDNDPETAQRFVDEARTAAALNHPNIVSVYDFGEIDGRLFMVMEFLDGDDLLRLVNENRIPDLREKLRIASEAAAGLRHVHQHGILHRDIKPGNIFVCATGNVKLIDFGIAKSSFSTSKTRAGFAVGTLHYMAPEQVRGEAELRTDIYAFGLVLFQLLTGQAPVRGDTVESIFYSILNEPLNLAPLEALHLPQPLIDLVRCCTLKDAACRPANFDEVCARLDEIRAAMAPQSTVVPPPPPTPAPEPAPVRRTGLLAAVGVLVPLAALAAWWMLRPAPVNAPATPPPAAKPKAAAPAPVLETAFGSMVLVPAGKFAFGSDGAPRDLPAFYIDKTEVTNDSWRRYCAEHGCPTVKGPDTLPVTDIAFEAARTFCETTGKHLPSAEEWEKAARGTSGFPYPWGTQENAANANVANKSGAQPVGSYPAGASPFGALDMAGNVWEFVMDSRSPTTKELDVFRDLGLQPPVTATERWVLLYGGSYAGPLSHVWDAALVPARYSDKTIGFRCAANP